MGEGGDPLAEIVRYRRGRREESARSYAEESRRRLLRNAETKIRTTMIGSLSLVEEYMGELWGHGKPECELTASERRFREVKDEMRTDILNLGNSQIRAMRDEMSQYEVKWNRYQYHYPPIEVQEEEKRYRREMSRIAGKSAWSDVRPTPEEEAQSRRDIDAAMRDHGDRMRELNWPPEDSGQTRGDGQ